MRPQGPSCATAPPAGSWHGDDELAEQIHAALEDDRVPTLRAVVVDLDGLSSILEADPSCTQGSGRQARDGC